MTTARTNDVHVGRYYGECEIEITPALVQHYADAVQDFNPWYFGDSPFGGPVAPALILHSEVYRSIDWYLNIIGNLHARQEWELFAPVMVGDTVIARRQIVDRYRRRDRDYVVNETSVYAADGGILNRGRTHQSFLINTDVKGDVVDKEREKRADRRFEAEEEAILEELSGAEKEITLEMCQKFSGPHKNYHTDREEARRLGFPDIVVQGMMSLCFLSQMMTDRFGAGWFTGGKMNVALVNVLWQGERVRAKGSVTGESEEGPRKRLQARVWCEKADGTKIVVGAAGALTE